MKIRIISRKETFADKIYLLRIFQGLSVTASHFFRNLFSKKNIVTIAYPEVKRDVSPRWRGRHRLTRKKTGFIKCIACYMCETVCPANCIHIEAAEHVDKSIEKYPNIFDIDELRCIFCGLCVEACPVDAIRMDTNIIALARNQRGEFDYTRDLLMDIKNDGVYQKYFDVPTCKTEKEALPNSYGILPKT